MSELCDPMSHFSSLIISSFVVLCSFILSHPLYFSYFIFFSPYVAKLVSFLSPLFITTILVFLSFLTGLAHETELARRSISQLLMSCASALVKQSSRRDWQDEESHCLEDFEMYHVLFGSSMEVKGNPDVVLEERSEENHMQAPEFSDSGDLSVGKCEATSSSTGSVCDSEESPPPPGPKPENSCAEMEGMRLESFSKILDQFERMSSSGTERKDIGAGIDKVVGKQRARPPMRYGSEAKTEKINFTSGGDECTSPVKSHSPPGLSSNSDCSGASDGDHTLKTPSSRAFDHNLGSYGSMRREKEWKRTLACKLFEERHNVVGGEGMDSLWEAYEMDSGISKTRKKDKKKEKKSEIEIEDEEEDEVDDGQLCCLQAIKMSSRKMNLGMGRPNLVKISKAIRGIGWLYHVGKNSKKVHTAQ